MKPERIMIGVGVLVATLALAGMVHNGLVDPLSPERDILAWRLSDSEHGIGDARDDAAALDRLRDTIKDRPQVWDALIPPPPPPPEPKKPDPVPPNSRKMLKGIRASRNQVGQRVGLVMPGHKRPDFFSVGDRVSGCALKEFNDTAVVFSYYWAEGGKELTYRIYRK